MMKLKFCALLLALGMALGLTACRFEWELGGLAGGVHFELQQNRLPPPGEAVSAFGAD